MLDMLDWVKFSNDTMQLRNRKVFFAAVRGVDLLFGHASFALLLFIDFMAGLDPDLNVQLEF